MRLSTYILEAQFKHDPIELCDFLIEPAIRSKENRVEYKGSIWVYPSIVM